MTIISGEENVRFASILALRSALNLKVTSGLNVYRGSLVKVTNRQFGTEFRTAKQCLAHVSAYLAEFDARRAEVTE